MSSAGPGVGHPGPKLFARKGVISVYMVQVLYHPADPASLEAEYPGHVDRAGALVRAARHVYVGKFAGQVMGHTVTRGVVFLFESKEAFEKAASSPEGAAVVQDAQRIAGPDGLSICQGEIDIAV